MNVKTIATTPFADQKPGTSGLRKKVSVFQQPGYLENFVQSIFDALPETQRNRLVVGGDGRFHNREAASVIVQMAIANGFKHVIVGRDALLSTPAASCVIREQNADGGVVLSASHNPGGPDGDFGIKFNNASGAPAPEQITDAIHNASLSISEYKTSDVAIDLNHTGEHQRDGARVSVVDPVSDYGALMEKCFDFDALRDGFRSGRLSVAFDAMHAITGPYASEILVNRLLAGRDSVWNGVPTEDFGGGHPDPNLVHAHDLVQHMMKDGAPALGAASDGDGDRNLIHGPGFFVTPSDSLALLARHHAEIPQFADGLPGVARSMPTSAAVDRVADARNIDCFVTPTGWKFFGSLLDADRIRLCGEESFGTGGNHVREKDGLWTVLAWLSVLNGTGLSVGDLVQQHWAAFGRNTYCRYDYEGVDADAANELMQSLSRSAPDRRGERFGNLQIESASDFAYEDPVDGSRTERQGLQIHFEGGSRCVFRLSGTGTEGATIRLYLERYVPASGDVNQNAQEATRELGEVANEIAGITRHTGREQPDVIT